MFANRLNVLVIMMLAAALFMMESGSAQTNEDDDFEFNLDHAIVIETETPKKYCGRILADTLQNVCDSVYNTLFKKIGNEKMEMAELPPFLSRAKAHSIIYERFANRRRRNTPGIYEECCVKGCTTAELKTYCGDPDESDES